MAEGLWKIPHELQGIRVNLLRVQSHMVCVAQEILENTQRFSCPAHPCETGDEPEATHQEGSLPGLRPAVRLVPVEQRVPRELLHHRVHRAHDSSVSRPCESYERHRGWQSPARLFHSASEMPSSYQTSPLTESLV